MPQVMPDAPGEDPHQQPQLLMISGCRPPRPWDAVANIEADPELSILLAALDIDDLLKIANREVTRSLTSEECRQYLHVDRCPPG